MNPASQETHPGRAVNDEGSGDSEVAEERAFEEMLAPLMPALLAYFVRRVLPREDSADCLSETMIVLWNRRWSLPADPEGRRAWAFGVAKRVLANHQRSSIRRGALSDRLRHYLVTEAAPPEHDDVTRALATLTAKDQELVQLIIWDGLGIAEAGALLGIRPSTARARYSRVKARLRHELDV